ncbi:class E sortase [Streptomyces xanthii]|uniref:Class E sortase n=1 Tax=Streptomyces xanthii TaxID=2768069 RepID=A0A7H1BJI0_9ACTN|nr:class E sortase [Streptomyces xanthii]QNS08885.1 class E sortase [Streptomyces xanthii]
MRRALWNGAEGAVTLGLVLLLFVAHQLWWTNRQAKAGAERQVQALEREWERPGEPPPDTDGAARSPDPAEESTPQGDDPAVDSGPRTRTGTGTGARAARQTPRWDQAYAVLGIPRLGLRVPVAQGVGKASVLNHGYAGHYPGTAQPGQAGNFALAGHRNTHGEPFRYINRLRRGDTLTVETKQATYTYVVDKSLAQTSARDGGVIAPVPRSRVVRGAGYTEPGYYITLTTCTPEFTSRYRLVVWGELRSMRPR